MHNPFGRDGVHNPFGRDGVHTVSTGLLRRIEFIVHPIRHIVFDIGCDAIHFRNITDNVVIETGLPCKIEGVLVGIMSYCAFQTSDDYR